MPDLIPGAMNPDDFELPAPRPDPLDARRSAEALREIERQGEHDPSRPRSRWEKRFDPWTETWIDVEVETGLPPLAEGLAEAEEREVEEDEWTAELA